MKVTFWGTRGSIASVGARTQIYGGNTSCVSIAQEDTLLILDAGSGLRVLANEGYHRQFKKLHILLTHLHMDHIQGLGFFDLFFDPSAIINLWGPPSSTASLKLRLRRYLSPPLFPVRIRDFLAQLHIHEATQDQFDIGPFQVTSNFIIHPGPTLGYRISNGHKVVTFIPDHEPALGIPNFPISPEWTSGYRLAESADLLIHDSSYSDEEYQIRQGWGHSSWRHALLFAQQAKVKRLELFHHDPSHDDEQLHELFKKYVDGQWEFEVHLASEENMIEL